MALKTTPARCPFCQLLVQNLTEIRWVFISHDVEHDSIDKIGDAFFGTRPRYTWFSDGPPFALRGDMFGKGRIAGTLLVLSMAAGVGCDVLPADDADTPHPVNSDLGVADLARLHVSLSFGAEEWNSQYTSGWTQHLVLRIPLPSVKAEYASDCPVLNGNIQFSLDGLRPSSAFTGGGWDTTREWGPDEVECTTEASVSWKVPLSGGRLPLRVWSGDGEAGMVAYIPPAYQPTIVSPSSSFPPGGAIRLEVPPWFCSDLGIDGIDQIGWAALLVAANGERAVSSQFNEIVRSDKTGVTVTLPPTTGPGTNRLYLTYYSRSDNPLTISQCAGFASCSGSFLRPQMLAPVTIEVTKE